MSIIRLKERYCKIADTSNKKQESEETTTVSTIEEKKSDNPTDSTNSTDKLLYCDGAVGKENDLGGIILLKDSIISIKEAASCPDAAKNRRKSAIDNNLLLIDGDNYILQEDMEFKSLSGAACFVMGSSVNGKIAWKPTPKKGK